MGMRLLLPNLVFKALPNYKGKALGTRLPTCVFVNGQDTSFTVLEQQLSLPNASSKNGSWETCRVKKNEKNSWEVTCNEVATYLNGLSTCSVQSQLDRSSVKNGKRSILLLIPPFRIMIIFFAVLKYLTECLQQINEVGEWLCSF